MSGKLRVHELAKQLGVTSKELLATLKEEGEFVKTASSTIEPPVVKKMKALYEERGDGAKDDKAAGKKPSAGAKKPAAKKPAAKKPAARQAAPTKAASPAKGAEA